MPLTIIPPGLTTDSSSTGTSEKKPFDSQEFLPNKLTSGSSEEFRLLGHFGTGQMIAPWRCAVEEKQPDGTLRFAGYDYSSDYESFPNAARQTDWTTPDRAKIEGVFVKPKRALCAIVWSYERSRVELAVIEQRSIKDSLAEVLQDADFGFDDNDISNFVVKIGKQGAGLETSYSLMPKPRKVEAEVSAAFAEIKETAKVEKLLAGGHPLLQPRAEFNSESSEF